MPAKVKDIVLVRTSGTLVGTDKMYVAADSGNTDAQVDLTEFAAYIAAFVVGGGATAEIIRDTIGAALVQAAGITITVNDAGDTITIAADPEVIRDTIGACLAAGAGITVTVNDAGDTITIASSITQYTDEMARDAIGAALVAGANVTLTVNDAGDTITIAVSTEAIQDVIGALLAAASGVNGGIVVTYNDAGDAESLGLASSAFQTLTDAAPIAWDMSAGYNAKVTLGANRTAGTPTNPVEGRTYSLLLIQDGTGTRTWTPAASMKFGDAGNPTLQTAAGKKDMVYLQCIDSSTPEFVCSFKKGS